MNLYLIFSCLFFYLIYFVQCLQSCLVARLAFGEYFFQRLCLLFSFGTFISQYEIFDFSLHIITCISHCTGFLLHDFKISFDFLNFFLGLSPSFVNLWDSFWVIIPADSTFGNFYLTFSLGLILNLLTNFFVLSLNSVEFNL